MRVQNNLQNNTFEGFMRMSAVTTLEELLTKRQPITFLTNSSDKLPWLTYIKEGEDHASQAEKAERNVHRNKLLRCQLQSSNKWICLIWGILPALFEQHQIQNSCGEHLNQRHTPFAPVADSPLCIPAPFPCTTNKVSILHTIANLCHPPRPFLLAQDAILWELHEE